MAGSGSRGRLTRQPSVAEGLRLKLLRLAMDRVQHDAVVCCKVGRLTRSLADFAKIVEIFGDCREFRAGLGMMGAKEPTHAATQRTSYP